MILVNEFRKDLVGRYKTGIAEILYWDMIIFCDLVITKSRDNIWIRIPQTYDIKSQKYVNILQWSSKAVSDDFQEKVKKELAEKFPEALKIPEKKFSRNAAKERRKIKERLATPYEKKEKKYLNNFRGNSPSEYNVRNNSEKNIYEKNEKLIPGKARNKSIFEG